MANRKIISIVLAGALAVGVGGVVFVGTRPGGDPVVRAEDHFLEGMIPHHEGAIEAAKLAKSQAEHPEIQQLAEDILRTQTAEIVLIKTILGPSHSGGHAHVASHGGDAHGPEGAKLLLGAKPFDKAFIDLMLPHHESAIAASKDVLQNVKDPQAKKLAQDIIAAQEREVAQMKEWRKTWYGS